MARGGKGRKRPVKKRIARAQSPGKTGFPRDAVRALTYSLDMAWDYPKEDKESIANFLNYNMKLGEDQIEWALNEITAAARHYRGEAIYEKERRPRPAEPWEQIEHFADSLDQLRECTVALSEEARAALDSFSLELDGRPVTHTLSGALKALFSIHSTIRLAGDASAKFGRPRMEARRIFIKRLAAIWAAVHGEWPNRTGRDEEREEFPFNLFAWECVEPLAGKSGLDDAIREVCEMDPSSTEAIIATYVPSKAPRKK